MNTDTRSRGYTKKLVVKRCDYDFRKYSFCNRVVKILNSLPNSLITATSVNSFKTGWILSGQIKKFYIIIKAIQPETETLRYDFQFNYSIYNYDVGIEALPSPILTLLLLLLYVYLIHIHLLILLTLAVLRCISRVQKCEVSPLIGLFCTRAWLILAVV